MHPLSLSIRVDDANPDHHLWNNNGTWWCHYTLHRGPRKQRCRISLGTHDVGEAREQRDELFASLQRLIDSNPRGKDATRAGCAA